jgi:hypothetical protein
MSIVTHGAAKEQNNKPWNAKLDFRNSQDMKLMIIIGSKSEQEASISPSKPNQSIGWRWQLGISGERL